MDTFQDLLAKAIAAAPTVEEGLRLWDTTQPPEITRVLAAAVSAGNLAGVQCCAIKATTPLSLAQQSQAICRWRQSPTAARAMDPKIEWAIGNELARAGLIDPGMTICEKNDRSTETWGPLAWCTERFLPHAALGLLQGFDQPDPDDLAHALSACIKKMSPPRAEDEAWMKLLEALLDRGADPALESQHRRPMETGAARNQLLSLAKNWCKRPEPLLSRLMGDPSWLTNETVNGFTPMLQWITMGGDEEVVLRLARGQSLTPEGLLRLVDRYAANGTKQDTNFFAILPRFVALPTLTAERVANAIMDNWKTALSSSRAEYPERILYKAGLLLSSCAPKEDQDLLVNFLDEIHAAMGTTKPKGEHDIQRMKALLGATGEAWLLARSSPAATGQRQAPRF